MKHESTASIAIVILNWNGIEDTASCVKSLLSQDYTNFHIVIVDNGSDKINTEALAKIKNDNKSVVDVIYNSSNLGFSGGVNTGIRWAMDNEYEHVALLNNDAIASEDWLSQLALGVEKDKVGIATGLLLSWDGASIDSSGEQYSKWGLPFPRNRGENLVFANEDGLVFGATGGATLYKTAVFEEIGLFDEDFFAYYEDVDICFRAQLAGWKINYTSQAVAYHKQGATSSKIPGFTVYQTFKNLPWLFIKNVPTKLLVFVGFRFYFAYFLLFWNAVFHGKGWPAAKGFLKHLVLVPRKLSQRRQIQRHKKVSSSYIKSILWDDLPPEQSGLRKLREKLTGIK